MCFQITSPQKYRRAFTVLDCISSLRIMCGLYYHFNNLLFKHRLTNDDVPISISSGFLCFKCFF